MVASKIFLFLPLFGEDEPILTSIFFKGVATTNLFTHPKNQLGFSGGELKINLSSRDVNVVNV